MNIPLMNLKRQFASIRTEVEQKIASTLDHGKYIMGPEVQEFESHFSEFSKVKHAIGVGNGTDALSIAMLAAEIKRDDHVFLPANTFFATAEAVVHIGAVPVLVDVDDNHLLLDTVKLEAAIEKVKSQGKRCGAIIPVHLYGNVCNMTEIKRIADTHQLIVIEDAAQAHGGSFDGNPVGSQSEGATFSFYPGKNLGAYGDAGAIITTHDNIAAACQKLRNHGRKVGSKYDHDAIGFNSRLDSMQAGILDVKLKHLREWTDKRRQAASWYSESLANLKEISFVPPVDGAHHVYHLFVIRTPNRDELKSHLADQGISAGIHYPVPLHKISAMQPFVDPSDDFSVAENAANDVLSLPICPDITEVEVHQVCEVVKSFFRKN